MPMLIRVVKHKLQWLASLAYKWEISSSSSNTILQSIISDMNNLRRKCVVHKLPNLPELSCSTQHPSVIGVSDT